MQTQLAAQLAEAEARRRQLESAENDCSRTCALDNNRPFTDGADAFARLLPWHVSRADHCMDVSRCTSVTANRTVCIILRCLLLGTH